MRICIPSYNRLSGVQEKTLKLLNKYESIIKTTAKAKFKQPRNKLALKWLSPESIKI